MTPTELDTIKTQLQIMYGVREWFALIEQHGIEEVKKTMNEMIYTLSKQVASAEGE